MDSPMPALDSPVDKKPNTSTLKRELTDENTTEQSAKKFGFGVKMSINVSNKNKLGGVFNPNDDDNNTQEEPKKKLSRLDDENEKKEPPKTEDKRKMIKNLIEKIPTVKEELFAYPLKWDIVDQVF